MSSVAWTINGLEKDAWPTEWDASINPVQPSEFTAESTDQGLEIFCAGVAYAGALAKGTYPWLYKSTQVTVSHSVYVDGTLKRAQVLETDAEFTDDEVTYRGDFQINIEEGWMVQVGNPWYDTGVKIAPMREGLNYVAITYEFDFTAKTIRVSMVIVNGTSYSFTITQTPPIPAAAFNPPWTAGQIVLQRQLCLGVQGGEYVVTFNNGAIQGAD